MWKDYKAEREEIQKRREREKKLFELTGMKVEKILFDCNKRWYYSSQIYLKNWQISYYFLSVITKLKDMNLQAKTRFSHSLFCYFRND